MLRAGYIELVRKILINFVPNSRRLKMIAHLPEFRVFMKQNSHKYPVFTNRFEMYDHINNVILANSAITFLEFGVFEGESIKYWSKLNTNQGSTLTGFDLFTGLPEAFDNFTGGLKKNHFDVGGMEPKIDDDRVSFVKGRFQDTLRPFLKDTNISEQLVIHNDSDLFSSSLYLLATADEEIKPGTIIIFDEFYSVMHEFKALQDYCSAFCREFEVVAATTSLTQIAIKMK